MSYFKSILFLLVITAVFGCKTSKTIAGGDSNLNLSTKQLVKENTNTTPNFKTLQSRLKIGYTKDGEGQSYSVNFRAKKDEVIWISATFSVVKALVTPEKVSFYNKLNGTYFEGDYTYLSNLIGTELDFTKLQNVLLGNAILPLDAATYQVSANKDGYTLQPKKQVDLFDILFLIDPVLFKIKSQQISQQKESRNLQIDYLNYQEVDGQKLPEVIKINAVDGANNTIIDLEFKAVTLNEDLNFPYAIPSGFKEIKL